MFLFASPAWAHHPHDPTDFLAPSPAFDADGVALATRLPAQNWRPAEIVITRDGGSTWSPSAEGLDNVGPITSLSVSPAFDGDGVAFLTTHGSGGYVTVDGAASWARVTPGDHLAAGVVAHDGATPVLLTWNEDTQALRRSTDLGATWTGVGRPHGAAHLKASGQDVAFLADNHLWVSDDAGASWSVRPVPSPVVNDLAVGPGVVAIATDVGVWLSEGGAPFARTAFGRFADQVALAADWATSGAVAATTFTDGVFLSEDRGASFVVKPLVFVPSNQSPEDHYYGLSFSPGFAADGRMFVWAFEGLWSTADRGDTWWQADMRPPALVNAIALSPDFATDGIVVVGTYDASAWFSADRGDTFAIGSVGLRKASLYDLAIGREAPGGELQVYGAMRDYLETFRLPGGTRWHVKWYRRTIDYQTRIALSPDFENDGRCLLGTRIVGLLWSHDGCQTFTQVLPDPMFTAVAWGPGSTAAAALLGGTFLSFDHGASFARTNLPGDPGFPNTVAAGPGGFLAGTPEGAFTSALGFAWARVPELAAPVYQVAVAADGTRFVSLRGAGLWRSDGGGTFARVGAGLVGNAAEIAPSPAFATDGTLFVSIDEAVFRSTDRGDTFEPIGPWVVRYEEDSQSVSPHAWIKEHEQVNGSMSVLHGIETRSQDLEFSFVGTGVAWRSCYGPTYGRADVELDGVVVETVHLGAQREVCGVPVWSRQGLAPGPHVLRVLPTGRDPVALDAFDVTRGP